MTYKPKNYTHLIGTPGFSEKLLTNHFKLYEGYVTNVNKAIDILKTTEIGTPQHSEVRRRFGWEFNGMRLHEDYFGNMSKTPKRLDASSALAKQIIQDFGSLDAWEKDFRASCGMRGVGWASLVYDPEGKRLFNIWINEHDVGHLAGSVSILVGDVFEHAYMVDYGINRADYIAAFMNVIDWKEVSKRFDAVAD